jgi:hypothetical protein
MHAEWRKSSFSGTTEAECVEVAYSTTVRLRDTKNRGGGILTLPTASWSPHRLTTIGDESVVGEPGM